MPTASEMPSSCSRNRLSASQGSRNPGVWEPCPGATTTITPSILPAAATDRSRDGTNIGPILCACRAEATLTDLYDTTYDASMNPIKRVSVLSTGQVQIRPQHVESDGSPMPWWLFT